MVRVRVPVWFRVILRVLGLVVRGLGFGFRVRVMVRVWLRVMG